MFKTFFKKLKRNLDIKSLQLLVMVNKGEWEFSGGRFYSPAGFFVLGLSDRDREPKIYPNGKWYEEGSVLDKWHKKYGYLTDIDVYYMNWFTPAKVYKYEKRSYNIL